MNQSMPVPIVMLPGYMTDADLWTEFAPALRGHVPQHAGLHGASLQEMASAALQDCPPRRRWWRLRAPTSC